MKENVRKGTSGIVHELANWEYSDDCKCHFGVTLCSCEVSNSKAYTSKYRDELTEAPVTCRNCLRHPLSKPDWARNQIASHSAKG